MIKEPGRELDALIAEKVMGFVRTGNLDPYWETVSGEPVYLDVTVAPKDMKLPRYSTDISAAWSIIEKYPMTVSAPTAPYADGEYANSSEELWDVELKRITPPPNDWSDTVSARAFTAPHAICLAVLKAIGYDGR